MIVTIEMWANREGGQLEDVVLNEWSDQDIDSENIYKIGFQILSQNVTTRTRRVMVGDVIRFKKERFMIDENTVLRLGKAS